MGPKKILGRNNKLIKTITRPIKTERTTKVEQRQPYQSQTIQFPEQPMQPLGYPRMPLEKPQEGVIADVYDLYRDLIEVHSPVPEITRDFTISQLKQEIVDNKLAKFIREQIKTTKVVYNFVSVPKEHPKYKEVKILAEKVKTIMMVDVYSMVVMSRAEGGMILKAILRFGRGQEVEDQPDQLGLKEKLFSKRGEH